MKTIRKITLILFLASAPPSAQAICVVTGSGNVAICPTASGETEICPVTAGGVVLCPSQPARRHKNYNGTGCNPYTGEDSETGEPCR
jgi:hypothetical protein